MTRRNIKSDDYLLKVVRPVANLYKRDRSLHHRLVKELIAIVEANPNIDPDVLRERFPDLDQHTINQNTYLLRAQAEGDEYVDGDGKIYYNVHGLEKVLKRRSKRFREILNDGPVSPLWATRYGRKPILLLAYYELKKVLETFPYLSPSHKAKRMARESNCTRMIAHFIPRQPSELKQAEWVALVYLLSYKVNQDRWLSEQELWDMVHKDFSYKPTTLRVAVSALTSKGYLVPRTSAANKNCGRTFWATRKCPVSMIVHPPQNLPGGRKIYIFRDFVQGDDRFVLEDKSRQRANKIVEVLMSDLG